VVKRPVGVLSRVFLILAFILPIGRSVQAGGAPGISSIEQAAKGVLRIRTYDWKGTLLQEGSGYFSSPEGNITTVVPVVEGGYFVEAIGRDGAEHIIDQINPLSQSSGLVFTHLEEKPFEFTHIEKVASFPVQGDTIWISEVSAAGTRELQKAAVLETREVPGSMNHLFVRGSRPLGGAGSPVINERGEVAGLVLFLAQGQDDAGIIVSTDRIRSSYGLSGEVVSLLTWTDGRTTHWQEQEAGLYLRGLLSCFVGEHHNAVQFLEKVVAAQGSGVKKASLALGDCYRDLGEAHKAINAYERGLGRTRRLSDSHMSLARLYLKQKRIADARRLWEETARYEQNSSNPIILTAWLFDAIGKRDEALAAARKAVGLNPDCGWAQGTVGEIQNRMGRFEEAFHALEQSASSSPYDNEFGGELCYAAIRTGRYDQAMTVCDKAARSGFEKSQSLTHLGDACAASGMNEKAIESYRLSVREDPRNLRAWCRRGDLLIEAGHPQKAAAVFQDALKEFPDEAWLHFKLGKVYVIMGDRKAAARQVNILEDTNQALSKQLFLRQIAGNDASAY